MATTVLADGYQNSHTWWNTVKKEATQYGPFLKSLYQQLDAGYDDKSVIGDIFCEGIMQRFPGSACHPGLYGYANPTGTLVIANREIRFASGWEITNLTVGIMEDTLSRKYIFDSMGVESNTYEVTDGLNIIKLRFDDKPEDAEFTEVHIDVLAGEVTGAIKEIDKSAANNKILLAGGWTVLFNDLYRNVFNEQGDLRMDELADKALLDTETRQMLIHKAAEYYQDQPKTKKTAKKAENKTNQGKADPRIFWIWIAVGVVGASGLGFYLVKKKRSEGEPKT